MSRAPVVTASHGRRAANPTIATGTALVVWAVVVAVGLAWGRQLLDAGHKLVLGAPPLLADARTEIPSRIWATAVGTALLVVVLPPITRRLSWPALLGATPALAAGWWGLVALVDGSDGLVRGLEWRSEYAPYVRPAGEPLTFLRGWVDHLPDYSIQLRGHPPGFALLVGALGHLGLATPGWVAAVVVAVGVSGLAAVLLTVRALVDEGTARQVAPFLVVTPMGLWMVTSVDALFVGVTCWLVWLFVASIRSSGRRADLLAAAAGVLGATALLLSYGMVLIGLLPLVIAWRRRRWRALGIAAGVSAALVLALLAAGYSVAAGLAATVHEYQTLDLDRPYRYFVVANLSAWFLAIGPAVVVGLALLRDRRVWSVVGGAVAAVVVADLSGLSKAEVERIWLPFSVWVTVAVAGLARSRVPARAWLALQGTTAVVLTATLFTHW